LWWAGQFCDGVVFVGKQMVGSTVLYNNGGPHIAETLYHLREAVVNQDKSQDYLRSCIELVCGMWKILLCSQSCGCTADC
jgi:hypothetical protein